MSRYRTITLELEEKEVNINWGSFALIIYYAAQIDPVKAKTLLDITMTEYSYRTTYDLPLGNIEEDNLDAHFNISEISSSIDFLQNTLIPQLNLESHELLQKYGGIHAFYNSFNNSSLPFLQAIGLNKEETYDSTLSWINFYVESLKQILQKSLDSNKPLTAFIR